jgi:hypothetical protein
MPNPYFYPMNPFNRCLLLLLLAGWLVAGCDSPGDGTSRHHGKSDPAEGNAAQLRPDLFVTGPGTLDGCVGLYTYDSLNVAFDSLDVDKGRKIFATKASSFAFVRIHNRNITLQYDRAASGAVDKKTVREVYRGGEYTAILVTHSLQAEGETILISGTLEIIRGARHFKVKVKGVSGC